MIDNAPTDRNPLTVDPHKKACGYILRQSCANCSHCDRKSWSCLKHGFKINLDRGICPDFDSLANRLPAPSKQSPLKRVHVLPKKKGKSK